MEAIKVPTREEVSPESRAMFDQITQKIGKLPNLYAVIGYSPATLKGFLQFDSALSSGVFSSREREAIYLVVSEVNECRYCLAAHTVTAKNNGFNHDETINIRKGISYETRLSTVICLAKYIAENQGQVDPVLLCDFFEAGYNEDALIELIGLVALRTFTNYVYAVTGVPLDFPEAVSLK
ncbi:carboxymuconolactone decarboxylase family protein [Mucilaginibacter rubeus]|uniref:Carboxymuconolactone decarboxylase family protein n=1 Tax=Mucilaginibacter rubeus TaxID=2027860 RepID=A0AAE6MHP6_9SPHI|nr:MULTISPECIES: carboxymuconolactone decarboxylase family protein [Mucilaginibacter]QEM03753.1 carboxymuconolactone decarboxylase family protein [Mucilaginibacter rubeus]QEM16364.1 carboxymuconolactone decarboxylase family protein [Mucilaginibacter gossypii]QTE40868.1 carboxymuconolactone decarboxylase family protein [Mucilaginibacter rubeus]QTE47471.1 carboxymuconolactone decarboxylase family protein [Mucilaginibacter rubeus]QTE58864.1 carboxymuconolactone decarboxylase family protein [Mucil